MDQEKAASHAKFSRVKIEFLNCWHPGLAYWKEQKVSARVKRGYPEVLLIFIDVS